MHKTTLSLFTASVLLIAVGPLLAAGGTSIVAAKGEKAHIPATWPAGAGELVNDPARTVGLNSWFSEWPNDVNQYGFEIATMDDLNRLIKKLAEIKTEVKQLRLCPQKEPRGLGWVTSLPEGNNTPVIFSIGDQSRIDEWYKHVRKPFGKMEFLAAPIAVPPTLTIYVQNKAVDLDKLEIPEGITVEVGFPPAVFHRANTKQEKEQPVVKPEAVTAKQLAAEMDEGSKAAAEKIDEFLKNRRASEDN